MVYVKAFLMYMQAGRGDCVILMQDIFKTLSMSVYLNGQIEEKYEKMSNAHAAIVSLYPP